MIGRVKRGLRKFLGICAIAVRELSIMRIS